MRCPQDHDIGELALSLPLLALTRLRLNLQPSPQYRTPVPYKKHIRKDLHFFVIYPRRFQLKSWLFGRREAVAGFHYLGAWKGLKFGHPNIPRPCASSRTLSLEDFCACASFRSIEIIVVSAFSSDIDTRKNTWGSHIAFAFKLSRSYR